jgi:hypothetical protein
VVDGVAARERRRRDADPGPPTARVSVPDPTAADGLPPTPGSAVDQHDATEATAETGSGTMSDASSTSTDESGTTGDDVHGGAEGHASDVPEESPGSESDLALSQKVADRESDDGH